MEADGLGEVVFRAINVSQPEQRIDTTGVHRQCPFKEADGDFLQQREIIENKRGIGFFTTAEAEAKILTFRREQFMMNELPVFFRNMYLLKMDIADIKAQYEQFILDNFNQ